MVKKERKVENINGCWLGNGLFVGLWLKERSPQLVKPTQLNPSVVSGFEHRNKTFWWLMCLAGRGEGEKGGEGTGEEEEGREGTGEGTGEEEKEEKGGEGTGWEEGGREGEGVTGRCSDGERLRRINNKRRSYI
ncbi:hypothetical protein Pmani_034815 [Petrolisthes manimaculis]|uniref:Uncharacterized protein n=1 Tax=Petrolisthes manimaculis TaxID=1843537 RepID=A0AAE1NMU5_9EUCA|nr:hypothetical protein Pmani_034815 [Petrolisthes manimaculis]